MTIEKRLFWSNVLMIVVPVFSTVLVGLLCVGGLWLSLIHGAGLGVTDQEDFTHICIAVSEVIEHKLESHSDLSSIQPLLQSGGMALQIKSGGEVIFTSGQIEQSDLALLAAADSLPESSTISQSGRSLYTSQRQIGGAEYTIYLLGGNRGGEVYSELKTVLALSVILVAFTVFLSILLTNRFLTRFVFKKIEEPLDILAYGVHEIRDGNLNYRIRYSRQDEFLPICSDFNEMAERLQRSVELTWQQERSRRELIAGISHDIRSPLTSIQAYVEGLLDGVAKTPETRRRYLETIKEKAETLAHIISQLFLFSQMELDEYPENPQPVRLDELIAGIVLSLREEYGRQGLSIETEFSPAELHADPVQLRRVVTNILENSLKYKDSATSRISIRLEPASGGVQLVFLDDGPGVPEEALPHLFEVFYRSDPSRRRPDQGSGLGLAIVSNAVRRMGGTAEAFCGEPRGLGIRIFLPCEVTNHGENLNH